MVVQRKWLFFPGRSKICCNGRIIMARQSGVFYFTLTLIIVTSALFFAFDGRILAEVNLIIPILAAVQFVFVLCVLLRTSFSDPGIIPRATKDEARATEDAINLELQQNSTSNRSQPPRQKDVVINGVTYRLKFCFTCKIFRPPRSSHCSICDNCVERFDHHCPWVGNCIGRRNYRYFYLFVMSLSVYCIYMFGCVIAHIVIGTNKDGFVDTVKASPASVVECVICFFSVWSIVGLSGFHSYLVFTNQTTNEDIKGTFSTKRSPNVRNPFTYGTWWDNCCGIIFGPNPPSLLDLRGLYIPELPISVPRPLSQNQIEYRNNSNSNSNDYPYPKQHSFPISDDDVYIQNSNNASNQYSNGPDHVYDQHLQVSSGQLTDNSNTNASSSQQSVSGTHGSDHSSIHHDSRYFKEPNQASYGSTVRSPKLS